MTLPSHQFVVPAYRDSPYLPACLASLCAQTSKSKVVITTSTPSDYIFARAKSYGVPVHVNEANAGITADWNFGLSTATEEIVTLAHQDDVYYHDFAEQTVKLFHATPNATICFTGYEQIDEQGRRLPNGLLLAVKRILRSRAVGSNEIASTRAQRRRLLNLGCAIPCPSVSLNRTVAPDFRFSSDYQINLDWDAWWRLHELDAPFVLSRRILIGHRIHRAAETSKGKQDGRRRIEDMRMFDRMWPHSLASALAAVYRLGY